MKGSHEEASGHEAAELAATLGCIRELAQIHIPLHCDVQLTVQMSMCQKTSNVIAYSVARSAACASQFIPWKLRILVQIELNEREAFSRTCPTVHGRGRICCRGQRDVSPSGEVSIADADSFHESFQAVRRQARHSYDLSRNRNLCDVGWQS